MPTARATRQTVAPLLVFVALAACGDGAGDAAQEAKPAARGAAASAAATEPSAPPRREPPLPAFQGFSLDGELISARGLLGRRALLFLFNPEVAEAGPAADAVAHVAALRQEHNFAVVGVALGTDAAGARAFASEHGLEFPIVNDASGDIAASLALRAPVALIGVDAEGYVLFGQRGISPGDVPDATAVVESQLRESLRLPGAGTAPEPTLGTRPKAPSFSATPLGGGERFASSQLLGRPAVVIFFLYTCPHCHHALQFLRDELAGMPEDTRPRIVGVSAGGAASAVRQRLEQDDLDFFPVLADDDFKVRNAYGVLGGVPDIFVLDSEGRVAVRVQGWRDDRDPALVRMWLAKLSGRPVPMLLHATGFSGNEACVPCHEQQNETWMLTSHARAFDTLVRHGAAAKPDCVGCHVVGWQQPGGYTIAPPTPHLENVGCETCHGRGGPHLSPDFVRNGDYESVCASCHDQKHSLGFAYATFLPRVSHAANADLAKLSVEEKRRILEEHRKPRPMLPTSAAYVGSEACRSCHAREFETWSKQPHAHAIESLEAKNATGDPACLACHTTAMGKPGGFPADGAPADYPDLARVGCESCHGPGGDHVGPDAPRAGTIVSLTDKCGSCVILQICGTCHDAANDPGFEFEVEQKIEAQKHGTIEPASARTADPSAALALPSASVVGWLERGFRAAPDPGRRGADVWAGIRFPD